MNITRTILRSLPTLAAVTTLAAGCGLLQRQMGSSLPQGDPSDAARHYVLLAGSAGAAPEEGEIQSFTISPATMAIEHTGTAEAPSPAFMALGPDRETLFVANETETRSTVSSYRLDPSSGELSLIGKAYTIGEGPACVTANGTYVVTANSLGGSISLTEADEKGLLAPVDWHIRLGDRGVSHPCAVVFASDGSELFAADTGLDRVLHFGIHTGTPPITLDAQQMTLPRGSGPRHIVLSSDDRYAYVVCEGTPQIFVYRNDDGALTEIQRLSTRRTGTGGSHIALSRDGRFLYSSHSGQGQDAIIAFAVDPESGRLAYLGTTPTGRHPLHFALSPDDRYLAVALRDEGLVRFYRRDRQSGALTLLKQTIRIDRPAFILWESYAN